jgi:hypothetical protein
MRRRAGAGLPAPAANVANEQLHRLPPADENAPVADADQQRARFWDHAKRDNDPDQ